MYGERNPGIGAIVLCHEGKPCDPALKIQDHIKQDLPGAVILHALLATDWKRMTELSASSRTLGSSRNMAPYLSHQDPARDPLQALSTNIRQSEMVSGGGRGGNAPGNYDRTIKTELAAEQTNTLSLTPSQRSPMMTGDGAAHLFLLKKCGTFIDEKVSMYTVF